MFLEKYTYINFFRVCMHPPLSKRTGEHHASGVTQPRQVRRVRAIIFSSLRKLIIGLTASESTRTFIFLAGPLNILRMAGADEAELREVLREWEEKRKPCQIIVLKE